MLELVEDLPIDETLRDLTQCDDGRLVVLPLDQRLGTVRQLARALRCDHDEVEQVIHVLEAVFDSDSGHLGSTECFTQGRLA